jgi:PAS domain S-box-containing protein
VNDRAVELALAESDEVRTRRALLHVLEDLQRERDLARQAHREWISTVDALRDPMMVHDGEGRIVRVNRAYSQRAGMTYREMLGQPYWKCFPPGSGPLPDCSPAEIFGDDATEREQEFALASGEIFISRVFTVARSEKEKLALHLFENVTSHRLAERRIRTLNTLYQTLSAVNHAIVHSQTRREVSERIARIATEIGVWQAAWVGFVDPATQRIVPEGWSVSMAPHVGKLNLSLDPALPEGQGPAGLALRTGEPYFCNDVSTDPVLLPWRDAAKAYGIKTVAAIPILLKSAPPGVISLYSMKKEIFTPEVRALVIEMGDDVTYALEMLQTEAQRRIAEQALIENQAKLRRGLEATIEAIAATVETRDPYTAGHQRRVSNLARALGKEMGLSETVQEGLHFGALVHDLGKIQVPAEILSKPTKLTKLEFELIKTHPQAGYDILKGIDFPWPVAEMVHQHHERLDGSGYPQGLKGDAIALEARILAVADVVEAMASHRPYRAGLGLEAALREIETKRGVWFDPAPVDACLRLFRENRFSFDKS